MARTKKEVPSRDAPSRASSIPPADPSEEVPYFGQPLEEGRDFYWEKGLMVLTGSFLRRRGYCCNSGCRHCPYDECGGLTGS